MTDIPPQTFADEIAQLLRDNREVLDATGITTADEEILVKRATAYVNHYQHPPTPLRPLPVRTRLRIWWARLRYGCQ